MAWYDDPKLWVMAAGIVGQAMIVWWRVGDHGTDIRDLKHEVDSLREWRAQAREQIRQLQNGTPHEEG